MISNAQNKGRAVLVVLVLVFLAVLGSGISVKTGAAVTPPVYDPISYYTKSAYVWKNIKKGRYDRILNGSGSNRPPGTVLILYPFGFKPSHQSFLFRSVFAPVAIWAAALTVLALPLIRRRSDGVLAAAVIAGLISMPLFYHFQAVDSPLFNYPGVYSTSLQWGLVDGLEGAVAALAVALVYAGISRSSVLLTAFGWLASVLSLYIKPSGVLVFGALCGIVLVELLIRYLREPERRREVLKFGGIVFAVGFLLFGAGLGIALHSEYLGSRTIAAAKTAQAILIGMTQQDSLLPLLAPYVKPVLGGWMALPMLLAGLLFVAQAVTSFRRHLPIALRLGMSAMIAAAAIFWWVALAGTEHRYLFPFLLMLVAWFVPDVLSRIRDRSPSLRFSMASYCLTPFALLGLLLYQPLPDIRLQHLLGVNLASGQYAEEFSWGLWLVDYSRQLDRPLTFFSTSDSAAIAALETSDAIDSINHKLSRERFVIHRPLNWVDNPGLNLQRIAESDFILMGSVEPPSFRQGPVRHWSEETPLFKQAFYWNRGVGETGLELWLDGNIKLVRVADPQKFAGALARWANATEWKNDFCERNRAFLESHR